MTIVDLDQYGPDFTANPYPYYARLRESGPVHRVRGADGGEFWLIVGHEEARAALSDPRLSKSPATIGVTMLDEQVIGPNLLVLDPPDHTRLRKLVSREFTLAGPRRCGPASSGSRTISWTRCCRPAGPTSSTRWPSRCRSS